DWRNGVIFKYTVRATDHSVAVGIPKFFDLGSALNQFAVTPFLLSPGQKYLNAGRDDMIRSDLPAGDEPFDRTARSFVSLPAGLRRYTFLASNDIIFATPPEVDGRVWSRTFGNFWNTRPDGTPASNVMETCPRWYVQPRLNAPLTDPQSPPRQVFFPPFEIQVDPQISVDQAQLKGNTPWMLIGVPVAVRALRTDPTTNQQVEVPLFVAEPNRGKPTRFVSSDTLQFRYYYTQSEGLAPTVAEMYLLKRDSSGNFVSVRPGPFACNTLGTGKAFGDPLFAKYPDPTHKPNAFYGRYGVTVSASDPALGPGVYRFWFRASDGRRVVEWPGDGQADTGLRNLQWTDASGNLQTGISHVANTFHINNPPSLTLPPRPAVPTVDQKTGAITWVIRVTYYDPDNDPPSQPYLVFPGTGGANDLVLVMQKQNPNDNTYTDGCVYELQSSTDPTVGAFAGRRNYYFSFMDNWGTADNPEDGELIRQPAGTQTLFLNSQPFLLNASVTKASGSLGDNYTFSVTYGDNENDPPLEINGVPQVRLYIDDKPTDFYLRTDNASPDFTRGVVYTVSVSGRQIGPGPHTFKITARDRYNLPAASDATGVGPSIDIPVLSGGTVQAIPDNVGGGSAVGYPLTDFVFRVRYQHQSNVAPAYVKVRVLNPGAGATELAEVKLTREPGQSGTFQNPGIWYSNADSPFRFGAPGNYQFYFEASDGESISRLDADGSPIQGPVVAAPVLTAHAPQPPEGVYATPFTFRVLYTHEANVPPAAPVRLVLVSPTGKQVEVPMQTSATDTSQIRSPGWLFEAKDIPLSETGIYHYSFIATDGATTVESALAEGPVAAAVDPPVLSDASVSPAPVVPGVGPKITYRLTYKQSQRLVPTIYVVADGQVFPMTQESPATADLAAGVVYAVTVDRDLPDGSPRRGYYFLVRGPGFDLRYPAQDSVPGPNAIPLLEAPAAGTVAPAQGHTATRFRFTVRVTDVDATADPRVSVLVANRTLNMAKVDPAADVRYGALYSVETTLPVGELAHSFTATDGTDVARLPASGSFPGPVVREATALNATLASDRVRLDGVSTVRVSGSTSPALPSAQITLTYRHQGGTSTTQVVTADAAGRFSDRFLPSLAGEYTITVECTGEGSTTGGGLETLTVTVDPTTISIPAGRGMYTIPVLLPSGDLSAVFGPNGYQVGRWNGTGYDFGGRSVPGALAPGVGFWLNAARALQATAGGPVVDHTQPYAVPVVPGWNQVGNPFLSAVAWGNTTLETSGGVMTLAQAKVGGVSYDHAWAYDPASSQYILIHATVPGARRDVAPWQGLWFKSNVPGRLLFGAPGRAAVQESGAERRRDRATERQWTIQLAASNGRQMDTYNFAGVSSEGRAAVASGLESPPPMGSYVDLYFGDASDGRRLATDFRPAVAGEMVWEFAVDTDVLDRAVTVFAPNLSELPASLEAYLEDVDAGGKRVYLRTSGGYSFTPSEAGARRFRLVVRPRTVAPLRISEVTVEP
ncbi:MAG: carboxypeptidase-like regulatory domain-containing protein, partial [Armatimonadota bacterium]|nr:carboxypeptidase-like regulatory domain-containing protein [Armatimonadota bacterium]